MIRPASFSASLGPIRARTSTISSRTTSSPLRSFQTLSQRVNPSFFQKHSSTVRSQTRSVSLHFPPVAFSARHPYLAITARLALSSVLGVGVLIGAILFHDAFTYSERHVDRVPVNPLALHPRVGGKKNLPIIEVNLDAEDDAKKSMRGKPRLVIVGGGWGVGPTLLDLTVLIFVSIGRGSSSIPSR